MAINSYEKLNDNTGPTSPKSSCSKFSSQNSRRLSKVDYTADDSVSSSNNKSDKFKRKKNISPYLTEDRIEMLSRITEKRLVRKKTTDFVSSYPLAVNIYKASSDEFNALKKSRKIKKSVLTLPNNPAPLPQVCTVSDMNDSEYFAETKDERKLKPRKRRVMPTNRKPRMNKAMQIFDRDAEYCSRLNIDLDSSSTDFINHFTGDGRKTIRRRNIPKKSDVNPHDVWGMLRNLNRFPFRPSPPYSEDSIASIKKTNTFNKRQNGHMDTKFIETCTTEEFTYYSNLTNKSAHNSQSSIDRVTVIDKQDAYQEICKELKVVKNKTPPYVRSLKNTKKVKANAKARLSTAQVKCDGGDNIEVFHQNGVNLEQKCGLPSNLQNNVRCQENKLMLTHAPSNNQNFECVNNCFYCQNDISKKLDMEFNESNHPVLLCGNSDSSNGDIIKRLTGAAPYYNEQNKSNKTSPCQSQSQINGIIKVVLSKGQNILATKKVDPTEGRVRSSTPKAVLHPQLTQADIKRRLANMKFPLVILAKDQLSSTPFKVTNYEPPQWAGLNEHVWPFMKNWQKKDNRTIANCNKNSRVYDEKTNHLMKGDWDIPYNNETKINKEINTFAIRGVNTVPLPNVGNLNAKTPKMKPMRQFKERMLQFLHKKPSSDVDNKKHFSRGLAERREIVFKKVVCTGTNTQHNLVLPKGQDKTIFNNEDKMLDYLSSNMKQPRAKGRWASDFIDNVIKKIKSGVYYNQDELDVSRNRYCVTKEDSVQTEIDFIKHDICINCIQKIKPVIQELDKTCDLFQSIPGFDDNLLDLCIETIDKNQIAIKHSVTNIVVQFDVAMPSEISSILHAKQSASCLPVSVTESHTNIFKSKTTIVNAMLPAEICSILPNTIKNIIQSKLVIPKISDKVETHLSTIAELTRLESSDKIKHLIPVHNDVSPELKILGQGNFINNLSRIITKTNNMAKMSIDYFEPLLQKQNLFPNIQTNILLNCQIDPMALHIFESQKSTKQVPKIDYKTAPQKSPTCLELQPYIVSNKQVVSAYTFNIIDKVSIILSHPGFTFSINLNMLLKNPISNLCYKNNENIKNTRLNTEKTGVSFIISDISIDSLYNGFYDHLNGNRNMLKPNIIDKDKDYSQINKLKNCKSGAQCCASKNRSKKRSFVKLYKKCKSMSNISNERSSTALGKITSIDDFFQALGSAKTLASVIDGTAERKILTSIKEMKNWINEITPRQALLILLLANKKETSNVVRYRLFILQGIAVKRITRASELDMEIEVIERENLNICIPYEGISYLPSSENQDSLLEELYWIAKTTASDYQKTFDESSEKLLKSLLEKRKKLNPSYLRVMARYVGLGLLKTPK